MPVYVGTSGWQYRDWRGVLYPADVPQRRWLEHYAGNFATVENNNAFYRLPARETFTGWRDRTPGDFVMAVKASRYLTHVRRLRDPAEPVARLLGAAAGLGDKLGPVLLQLPPNLTADPPLLDACLREFARIRAGAAAIPGLRTPVRVAVEPRHDSWWSSEVRQVLTDHHAALVWIDRLGHPLTPQWDTAGWGYLRFHEGAANPWPRYGRPTLTSWAERITQTWPRDANVYAYFNNDQGGAAVHDAAAFAAVLRDAGRQVTRTPAPDEVPAG
ncbi:MAG TPA: DUF72 domain-containing protein [Streptosporangiaceae bacterium]|nr:DUF72 domain-containing protein [Streptosporangiaceae bacterium]